MPKRAKTVEEPTVRLRAAELAELRSRPNAVVEIVDQAVAAGQWSFDSAGSFRRS